VDHWPVLFETYLFRELQWMRQRGHSTAVVSFDIAPHAYKSETEGYVDLKEYGLEDVPVLQLDSKQMPFPVLVAKSLAFARLHQAQFIDAHLAREPAEVACRMHLVSGIPYAVRMRGGDIHSYTSPMLAEIVHYASAVCPMSQFLADILVGNRILKRVPQGIPAKVHPGRLHVIPNSLPVKYLARTPAPQSDVAPMIGAIGRATPIKRFDHLIEAVAGLVPDFPGLKLKIIGGGMILPELQSLASRAGIEDRFEITGFRSWTEVMDLVRQFHIYVQASELEGCSLANIEAAFQGIPLVLSRTGANEQCVEQGVNGYLFDPGDITALRESLRALLLAGAHKREQMGRASLEIVGRRFSQENIMPQLEALFQDAIDAGRQPQPMSLATVGDASGGNFND